MSTSIKQELYLSCTRHGNYIKSFAEYLSRVQELELEFQNDIRDALDTGTSDADLQTKINQLKTKYSGTTGQYTDNSGKSWTYSINDLLDKFMLNDTDEHFSITLVDGDDNEIQIDPNIIIDNIGQSATLLSAAIVALQTIGDESDTNEGEIDIAQITDHILTRINTFFGQASEVANTIAQYVAQTFSLGVTSMRHAAECILSLFGISVSSPTETSNNLAFEYTGISIWDAIVIAGKQFGDTVEYVLTNTIDKLFALVSLTLAQVEQWFYDFTGLVLTTKDSFASQNSKHNGFYDVYTTYQIHDEAISTKTTPDGQYWDDILKDRLSKYSYVNWQWPGADVYAYRNESDDSTMLLYCWKPLRIRVSDSSGFPGSLSRYTNDSSITYPILSVPTNVTVADMLDCFSESVKNELSSNPQSDADMLSLVNNAKTLTVWAMWIIASIGSASWQIDDNGGLSQTVPTFDKSLITKLEAEYLMYLFTKPGTASQTIQPGTNINNQQLAQLLTCNDNLEVIDITSSTSYLNTACIFLIWPMIDMFNSAPYASYIRTVKAKQGTYRVLTTTDLVSKVKNGFVVVSVAATVAVVTAFAFNLRKTARMRDIQSNTAQWQFVEADTAAQDQINEILNNSTYTDTQKASFIESILSAREGALNRIYKYQRNSRWMMNLSTLYLSGLPSAISHGLAYIGGKVTGAVQTLVQTGLTKVGSSSGKLYVRNASNDDLYKAIYEIGQLIKQNNKIVPFIVN